MRCRRGLASTSIDAMTVVEIYTEGDEEGRMAAERNLVE